MSGGRSANFVKLVAYGDGGSIPSLQIASYEVKSAESAVFPSRT